VPEENFWTFWCKGRLTEADKLATQLGATPSRLTSAYLHHPPTMNDNGIEISLELISEEKDLGVWMDDRLKFSTHIGHAVAKGNHKAVICSEELRYYKAIVHGTCSTSFGICQCSL